MSTYEETKALLDRLERMFGPATVRTFLVKLGGGGTDISDFRDDEKMLTRLRENIYEVLPSLRPQDTIKHFNGRRTAPEILAKAAAHLQARAAARDQDEERSMTRCVDAYNAITGHTLSERDGWMFMVVLKATRACSTATGLQDDYEDGAAYMALAGESVA
jgi:hypothetical protein